MEFRLTEVDRNRARRVFEIKLSLLELRQQSQHHNFLHRRGRQEILGVSEDELLAVAVGGFDVLVGVRGEQIVAQDALQDCVVTIPDVLGSGRGWGKKLLRSLVQDELSVLLHVQIRWDVEGVDHAENRFGFLVVTTLRAFLKEDGENW